MRALLLNTAIFLAALAGVIGMVIGAYGYALLMLMLAILGVVIRPTPA